MVAILFVGVLLMADPLLTGLLSSEDETLVTDVLGRQAPISLRGQPTLPVGGAPVTGGAGPVAPGGTGVGPAFTGGGSARGTRPAGDEVTGRIAGLGQKVLEQLRRGGVFDDSPSGARNPETEQAFQAQRAGERTATGGGATAAQLPPDAFLGGAPGPASYGDVFLPPGAAAAGGAGAGGATGTFLGGAAGPASYGDVFLPAAAGGAGAGAGAAGAGAAGASAGTEAAAPALSALLGAGGVVAGPLLSILYSTAIEPSQTRYRSARSKAYSLLGQKVEGGFAPGLQAAVSQGPEAVQALLTPEKLKEFGLEASQDPRTGEYTVGLSSVGHPYIKYSDALNAQTQLTQAVNQALQVSRAFQLIQQPTATPAPEPASTPPTTPAGGGPLGLAEIGLEVGQ